MGKLRFFFLILLLTTAGNTEELQCPVSSRQKETPGYCSRDSTVLSMMGWGLGIIAGIATLFALLDSHPGEGSSS